MARTFAVSMTIAAVALLWTSAEATAEPPDGTTAYAIGKCVDPNQPVPQRPAEFDYNCDATGVMQDMVWTSWDRDGARGSGTDASIECQPNCAQGARLTNPIVVHAWNPLPPSSIECPQAVEFYSDLTIAYPKGVPPWIMPGTTWDDGTDFVTIDGMPAVHFSDLKPNCRPR